MKILDALNQITPIQQDIAVAPDYCDKCKEWGKTVFRGKYPDCPDPIPCPVCGRLTWPNLGVNLPAGAAWAMSSRPVDPRSVM